MKIKILGLMAVGLLVGPMAADAVVVYEQGNISTADRGGYQYFGQALADDFVALSSGQLTNATWTGSYYGSANGTGSESFTFNLFAGGATPGALLYSTVGVASLVASATPTYFNYAMSFTGPGVIAGAPYWVSIYSNDSPTNYAWANSFDGSSAGAFSAFGGAWSPLDGDNRSNHVFALTAGAGVSAVPEPGTLALLGLGLLGLCASRRRKTL